MVYIVERVLVMFPEEIAQSYPFEEKFRSSQRVGFDISLVIDNMVHR